MLKKTKFKESELSEFKATLLQIQVWISQEFAITVYVQCSWPCWTGL